MANEFSGKVAIVTGGSSGIGYGTAERLIAEGGKVVIADINRERGASAAKELGSDAAFKETDVSDTAQVQEMVDFTIERFGGIHLLFNNAGISGERKGGLFEDDFGDFHQVLGINLLGVMAGTAAAAKHMAKHGGGAVINNASIGGMQATPGQWAYNSSKAAVIHFTRSAAVELGPHGIRVNCIAPGNVETEIMGNMMGGDLPPAEKEAMMVKIRAFLQDRQPIKLQGKPSDVAEAVLYLGTDRSRYVTGTVIPVDGGQVTGNPSTSKGFNSLRQSGKDG